MRSFFLWLFNGVRYLFGLILPVFQKAPKPGTVAVFRLILQIIVFLAVLVLLWCINQYEAVYTAFAKAEYLARFALPFLFVLVYVLCLLSNWLWRLLVAHDDGLYFRDIDLAWQEAMAALESAEVGLKRLPVFLVLGHPAEEENALFEGAKLDLVVNQVPNRPTSPLHVYATRQAIYVTFPGASLLSYYSQCLSGKIAGGGAGPANEIEETITETMRPRNRRPGAPLGRNIPEAILEKVKQLDREGRQATKDEVRELRAHYRRSSAYRSPLKDSELLAKQAARLEFCCRLVVRDRAPYCAINGVLVLVPFAGTDGEQDATSTADALARDLKVTRATLKMNCPHFVLLCDLETAPGFPEFIQSFSPEQRVKARIGQKCPLNPDFREVAAGNDGPAATMLESLGEWVGTSAVPPWVWEKFQLEKAATDDRVAVIRNNSRLFLLSCEMQERSRRLGKVLAQSGLAAQSEDGPLLMGGCYLAGTGPAADNEQAFIKGVVHNRLIDGQSCVYWTKATLAEETMFDRWLVFGWTLLLVGVWLPVAGFAIFHWLGG